MISAIEFEEAILGAVLLSKTAIERCSTLQVKHFFEPKHQKIYQAVLDLYEKNEPIDILTVANKTGELQTVMKITSRVSSSANMEYHISILIEKFMQRELLDLCQRTITNIYAAGNDIFKIQADVIAEIESHNMVQGKDFVSLGKSVMDTIKEVEAIQASGKSIVGIDSNESRLSRVARS